jgi:pyruvate ferredoxin oxidoreductase delta subunit
MKDKKAQPDFNYCKGCGLCAEICPVDAVQMVPEQQEEKE